MAVRQIEPIDRAELRATIQKWIDAHTDVDDTDGVGLLEDVLWEINAQPTLTPPEIVYCQDCENHWDLTRKENIADREAKGRNITHSGEENVNAKLSKKKVKEARQKRFLYHTKYIDLAKEYGVCKKTIMDAVKGKSWKCVNYLPAPPDRRPPEGDEKR